MNLEDYRSKCNINKKVQTGYRFVKYKNWFIIFYIERDVREINKGWIKALNAEQKLEYKRKQNSARVAAYRVANKKRRRIK
jgi:hypothetical protein